MEYEYYFISKNLQIITSTPTLSEAQLSVNIVHLFDAENDVNISSSK